MTEPTITKRERLLTMGMAFGFLLVIPATVAVVLLARAVQDNSTRADALTLRVDSLERDVEILWEDNIRLRELVLSLGGDPGPLPPVVAPSPTPTPTRSTSRGSSRNTAAPPPQATPAPTPRPSPTTRPPRPPRPTATPSPTVTSSSPTPTCQLPPFCLPLPITVPQILPSATPTPLTLDTTQGKG